LIDHLPSMSYIYTYTHIYSHSTVMQRATLGKCMYLNIPTYIHTYIPIYIHTFIHTYIYTYIHIYIHTRTRDECYLQQLKLTPPNQVPNAKYQMPNDSYLIPNAKCVK